MPIVRFDHLADLLVLVVRNTLNGCDGKSPAHAKLAYCYVWNVVIPELRAIYNLSKEKADEQAKGVPPMSDIERRLNKAEQALAVDVVPDAPDEAFLAVLHAIGVEPSGDYNTDFDALVFYLTGCHIPTGPDPLPNQGSEDDDGER